MFQSVSRNAAASSPPSANKLSSGLALRSSPPCPPSLLAGPEGQSQGSGAEDLAIVLPGLVYQPCRLWQSAGSETQRLPGRGEVCDGNAGLSCAGGLAARRQSAASLRPHPASLGPGKPESQDSTEEEEIEAEPAAEP